MKTLEEMQQMLNETVNRLLGQHRGRVDVVKIVDEFDFTRTVHTKMSGGCQGCAGAKATMKSIVTNYIKEFDPTISKVEDATDHTDNINAFFKENL